MFPVMRALWAGQKAGSLQPEQRRYFDTPRPAEELYDTVADPFEIHNLAGAAEHDGTLVRMPAGSQAIEVEELL